MLTSNQFISVPFSLVCLDELSCGILKLSLYAIGFVASRGQVERKCLFAELNCSHFPFINITSGLYTGLVIHFNTVL